MNTPLDELQWKSPEWIQAFGLRTDNVLDYFAESPFFDKTSNNHVIKMQRQFSQMPGDAAGPPQNGNNGGDGSGNGGNQFGASSLLPHQDMGNGQNEFSHIDAARRDVLTKYPMYAGLERELSKLRGVEYVLACAREPDFWIIKKQERNDPTSTRVLQDYYIIGANVYQAPTLFNVVQSRLMSTNYHLSQTIKNLHKLTVFQPSQGVQFKSTTNGHANTSMPSGNTVTSVPATANTGGVLSMNGGTSTVAGQTANTAQFESNRTRDTITQDLMDKLMITSIKSKPEYIQ